MLQLDQVSYSYAGGGQDVPAAVRDASLAIEPGTLVGLLGHNGSGKSTLAKLMSGVLLPQSGRVTADGFDTRDREGVWAVRERVGLVFQNPDDQLVTNTLLDEIAFGPENLGLSRDEIERRVAGAIRLLGLERYIDVPLNELSIGQRQRVAVAGVLAMRPRYIVLDEPTTMLPHHLAIDLLDTLRQLAREDGVGVIYITHRVEEITGFDRVLVADRGELVLDGAPRSIFGAPDALTRVGLEPPVAARIAAELRARGAPLPDGILTGEELAKTFQMLGRQHLAPDMRSRPDHQSAQSIDVPTGEPPASAEAPDPVLETRDVRHVYLRGTPFEQMGLDGLSMTVPRGAFVACVGPTRSGKSTLADCLNGIIRPGRGMVFFSGQDVAAPGFDLDRLREAVGVVYQNPESQILKDIVGKDISFGPMRKKVSLADSRQIVRESLEAVGLPYEEFRNRYTYALSGGEKRRVAIAGVLAMRPSVLVLDEPVAGLDPRGRAEFLALIRRLHTEGELTIVYLSASLEDALDLATDVYVMDAGRVAFTGAPYLRFLLPGTLVMAVLLVTMYSGIGLNTDIASGVFERFRTAPVWSPAPIIGYLLGDTGRYLLASTLVIALGLLLGFRPDGGVVGVLLAVALVLVFALSLSWIWMALGLVMRTPAAVTTVGTVVLFPLTLASNVFVDPKTMPGWLQAFVNVNPVTHLVVAARGLMHGTPSIGQVGWVLVASAVLIAVFAPLTMYLYGTRR